MSYGDCSVQGLTIDFSIQLNTSMKPCTLECDRRTYDIILRPTKLRDTSAYANTLEGLQLTY